MRVAEHLGQPAAVVRRMGMQELAEWRAWERITGPLGSKRLNFLAGWIAHHVAAAGGIEADLEQMIPWLDRGSPRARLRRKWAAMSVVSEQPPGQV